MKKKPASKKVDPTIKLKATVTELKRVLQKSEAELRETKRELGQEKIHAKQSDKDAHDYYTQSKDLIDIKHDTARIQELQNDRMQVAHTRVQLAEEQERIQLRRLQARRRLLMFDLDERDFYNINIFNAK